MPFVIDKYKLCDVVIALVLAMFCGLILWNANWVFEMFWADDNQFVSTTAIGKHSHAWTGGGRFWPLGLCDYCLLLLIPFGTTVTAHFIYNCATMIISSWLFFRFLKKSVGENSVIPAFCMLVLFSISSFVLIHTACIYPEREMFFMLSVFLFFYQRAVREDDYLRDYVIAFIAAAYTTYLKEPVFGMWIIFAVANLIFGNLSSKNRKFNYALLINSAIWIAIYTYRTLFRDRTFIEGARSYAGVSFSISDMSLNFMHFFNGEPILYILLIISVIRCIDILIDKNSYNFITDSSLFAGMGYAFAYVVLKLNGNHYCFPIVLLSLPAFSLILSKFRSCVIGYVMIGLTILSSMYSANKSIAWINKISQHRISDPKMFYELIEQQKSGKQILWITEKGKEIMEDFREIEQGKFRKYQKFLDYYAKVRGDEHFPFEKVSDYSKINRDTIVICSDETLASSYGKEITKKIEETGLVLKHSNNDLGAKIFSSK